MSARDELLDALVAERYNGGGWATPEPEYGSLTAFQRLLDITGDDDDEEEEAI